jgi:predicted RNase H-like HicB family nuclease
MKAKAIIEKGKDGTFDVNLEYREDLTFGLLGQGNTVEEAIEDFYVSRDEIKEYYQETGKEFPENLEFEFRYDMASFLDSYSDKISLAGLGRLTGINPKQLSHYLTRKRNPSPKTVKKIEAALHEFGKEISQVHFI